MNSMEQAHEAVALYKKIRPLLAGVDPGIQGATLGQMVAMFIAGHRPELRRTQYKMMCDLIRTLVPSEVEAMIEMGVVGPEWRGGSLQ